MCLHQWVAMQLVWSDVKRMEKLTQSLLEQMAINVSVSTSRREIKSGRIGWRVISLRDQKVSEGYQTRVVMIIIVWIFSWFSLICIEFPYFFHHFLHFLEKKNSDTYSTFLFIFSIYFPSILRASRSRVGPKCTLWGTKKYPLKIVKKLLFF